jgi:broad specificity phosphatase PhoE
MPGGESLDDVRTRLHGFLRAHVEPEPGRILIIGHGMLFMTWLWLFCENRAPTLQDHYMGRGHLSVVEREAGRYRLRDFNLPPG